MQKLSIEAWQRVSYYGYIDCLLNLVIDQDLMNELSDNKAAISINMIMLSMLKWIDI